MEKIKFSRNGQRRFNKQVKTLINLSQSNEKLFLREWNKQVQEWLRAIHRRAKNWKEGVEFRNTETTDGSIERGRTQVFGVLLLADTLLQACGEKIEKSVGSETRQLLTSECVKAVALVCDNRLNYMIDHKNYRRAKY